MSQSWHLDLPLLKALQRRTSKRASSFCFKVTVLIWYVPQTHVAAFQTSSSSDAAEHTTTNVPSDSIVNDAGSTVNDAGSPLEAANEEAEHEDLTTINDVFDMVSGDNKERLGPAEFKGLLVVLGILKAVCLEAEAKEDALQQALDALLPYDRRAVKAIKQGMLPPGAVLAKSADSDSESSSQSDSDGDSMDGADQAERSKIEHLREAAEEAAAQVDRLHQMLQQGAHSPQIAKPRRGSATVKARRKVQQEYTL